MEIIHEEFASKINEAISKSQLIFIACNCTIWYSGRAESFLPEGDRIIIIKPDKNLLVHQPKGSAPVNYMKEDSYHSISKIDDGLFINSSNLQLKEYLDIKINALHFYHTQSLEDNQKIQISGTEKDMADYIYSNPGVIEQGFKPLSTEEHTKYGFIDVFGHDKNNVLVVIECKRYTGDLKAVDQLGRYVEKIKKSRGLNSVRGILACPKISPNALMMLHDLGFEYREIRPPKYLERYDKKQKSVLDF